MAAALVTGAMHAGSAPTLISPSPIEVGRRVRVGTFVASARAFAKEIEMRSTLSTLVVLTAVGCASAPPPHAEVASATAAVRGAEEGGALQVPEAALHVKLAEEQVNRARQLMEDEQNERARTVAVRAYQDAELALALARVAQADRQLQAFLAKHPSAASRDGRQGEETPNGENPNGATTSQPEPTTVQ